MVLMKPSILTESFASIFVVISLSINLYFLLSMYHENAFTL